MTVNNLKPSAQCAKDVSGYEGFSNKAYPDPKTKGPPITIGFGTTCYPSGKAVSLGDVCTANDALSYLQHDLEKFGNYVNQYVTVKLNQNQFDALTSFTYNLGPANLKSSTLLKKLNAGDYNGAANEFLKWVSPGTAVEKGLRIRRAAERKVFLS